MFVCFCLVKYIYYTHILIPAMAAAVIFSSLHRVTASFDGSLRVWDTANWEVLTIIGAAHAGVGVCVGVCR